MRYRLLCGALLGLLAWTGAARAKIGSLDTVPAATLLLPYFEVDPNDLNGITTLISINNASASATLAHVTLWTDCGIPTLGFDVYLTGYDVEALNLRDIFRSGMLPWTASDGQDPTDQISPQGPYSQDINFASCNDDPNDPNDPFLPPLALTGSQVFALRTAHTGQASSLFGGKCGGRNLGDDRVRGYLTIDVTNQCTTAHPGEPGYFVHGGGGVAGNRNILWGDSFVVHTAHNFAYGELLVSIEADATDPKTSGPHDYTFYGRYTLDPNDPSDLPDDNRERLPSIWALPGVLTGTMASAQTEAVVWRDSYLKVAPFTCGLQYPSGFPLPYYALHGYDRQGTHESVVPDPNAPDYLGPPFAVEASITDLATGAFPLSFEEGWAVLDLNVPFMFVRLARQAHVSVLRRAEGRFEWGNAAVPVDRFYPTFFPMESPADEADPAARDPRLQEASP